MRRLAQRNVIDADCHYSNTGEACIGLSIGGRRDHLLAIPKPPTPSACSPASTNPDLKATFDVRVTAPAHWKVISTARRWPRQTAYTPSPLPRG